MIALVIIGLTAVVLLDRRVEIVRDAERARDTRLAWVLAARKLAELEMDPAVWQPAGGQSNGDFSDVDAAYGRYLWEYAVVRVPVPTNDPLKTQQKPKEILRLTLRVVTPAQEEPILLEALFPVDQGKPPAPEAAEAPGAAPPGQDPPGGTPPARQPLPPTPGPK
jgi:hypothetical protein